MWESGTTQGEPGALAVRRLRGLQGARLQVEVEACAQTAPRWEASTQGYQQSRTAEQAEKKEQGWTARSPESWDTRYYEKPLKGFERSALTVLED